jgi:hypothetical protein
MTNFPIAVSIRKVACLDCRGRSRINSLCTFLSIYIPKFGEIPSHIMSDDYYSERKQLQNYEALRTKSKKESSARF